MKLNSILVFCCQAAIASALPTSHQEPSFNWEEINFFLAFGDSYTFVHGTAGLENYSFIGDNFDFSFTPQQLLTNEIVQDQLGTSAGGPNWVEYLTGCFSGLPSKCKKQLWDFAFAGSDVSTIFTPLHHNYTVSFVNQILQWNLYARPVIPVDTTKALVAVFIGINDISDSEKYTFPRNNATDFASFYQEIIETEFEALETVYNAGYRNYLFMNLPPLDRTPANVLPNATILPSHSMLQTYNNLLSTASNTFASTHPGTKTMLFDTYSYLSAILDDPSKYGIKNTTGYCPNYDAPDIDTDWANIKFGKISLFKTQYTQSLRHKQLRREATNGYQREKPYSAQYPDQTKLGS
ncbi:hypothetical protein G7Y89_g9917 [Cudoniella acicularis]|uniref:Lysophospholipase A n=1 Tax=Cudoniella acicularis TaxID=354080 RepID=A0A8H4RDR8_9HELO|nr:hypothetical protein G7Y89_g9917 [Cudoniella acicularis]